MVFDIDGNLDIDAVKSRLDVGLSSIEESASDCKAQELELKSKQKLRVRKFHMPMQPSRNL